MPSNVAAAGLTDLASILVNDCINSRPLRKARRLAERKALGALNEALAKGPAATLRCLANVALHLCNAGTAGVSVLDNDVFRWQAMAGKLTLLEGGTTSGHSSLCGACLDAGKPLLYSWPARRFPYIAAIDIPVVEGLFSPVYANGEGVATIWIVSHDAERAFDAEDVRIMSSLAKFAGAAFAVADAKNLQEATDPGNSDRDAVWAGYIFRIGRNDAGALSALFCEARAVIFATALRILGYPADAEEIASDVFTRIWNRGYTFEPTRGSAIGWMLTITRNLSFERLRARAPELQMEYGGESSAASPESSLQMTQTNNNLHRAIALLPFDQRQAIELAFLAELSHSEIAEHLSKPLGTIKTRIRSGLGRLRNSLET